MRLAASPVVAPCPRIVLVEDHAMIRELLAFRITEMLGKAEITCCPSFAAAAAECRRIQPELAVVDWMLPDGCGGELMRSLGPESPRTRWLFVTANGQTGVVREALRLGAHGFVLKCADLYTFGFAVREVLAGRAFFCPQALPALQRPDEVALTPRETDVLRAVASGENPKEIAGRLGLCTKTVQNTITALKQKLGRTEIAGLVLHAIRTGLVAVPPVAAPAPY